ncbi:MAG: hypothetical protein ACRCVJ_11660 [Clostridium sp.]|uniref:hypothetical protein n=1 Tax=Clostridium sp. TaxID=1506 RepID=UPI003F3E850F
MDLYESLLAYAELKGIELMPYQKQMLKAYCEGNSIIMPRQFDRSNLIELAIDCQEQMNKNLKDEF